jgi:hypothetical protein
VAGDQSEHLHVVLAAPPTSTTHESRRLEGNIGIREATTSLESWVAYTQATRQLDEGRTRGRIERAVGGFIRRDHSTSREGHLLLEPQPQIG